MSQHEATQSEGGASERLRLEDRLLIEAVRAWEQREGMDRGAGHPAEAAARQGGGSFARRVLVRARGLPVAGALGPAIQRVRQSGELAVLLGVVAMTLIGFGAARAVLEATDETGAVNVYVAVLGLLGVQTLMLGVWAAVTVFAPATVSRSSLAGLVSGLGRWIGARVAGGPAEAWPVVQAYTRVLVTGPAGRSVMGSLTHGLWLAFNVGALVGLVVLLSVRHYVFAWETTILSPGAFAWLTQALGALPGWLGMAVPTGEQVAATQRPAEEAALREARQAWSGFLIGALICYGLLPRLVLLAGCAVAARRAVRRSAVEAGWPGWYEQQLRSLLEPTAERIGIVDPDDTPMAVARSFEAVPATTARPVGPPAIVGFEVEPPTPWPPGIDRVQWEDLGFVDSRTDRQRLLERLGEAEREPTTVVVVCSLTTTPDRGTGAFLRQLREAQHRPVTLVLSGGQALRERGESGQVDRRVEQWRALAGEAGLALDRVMELDLDYATDTSRAALRRLVVEESEEAGSAEAGGAGRRVERAFELIVRHARQWQGEPGPSERARLHGEIAKLYEHEQRGWREWLGVPGSVEELKRANWQELASGSARRVTELLPASLRLSPRWVVAGAATGALGCVAAATLIWPAAIVTLPSWSVLGAAVGAVFHPRKKGEESKPDRQAVNDVDGYTEAVDAAVLFALLLELQGRSEATIGRVLERVLGGDEQPERLQNPEQVQRWLEEVRHRLDRALAGEVSG